MADKYRVVSQSANRSNGTKTPAPGEERGVILKIQAQGWGAVGAWTCCKLTYDEKVA